jgi:hypothetical protein
MNLEEYRLTDEQIAEIVMQLDTLLDKTPHTKEMWVDAVKRNPQVVHGIAKAQLAAVQPAIDEAVKKERERIKKLLYPNAFKCFSRHDFSSIDCGNCSQHRECRIWQSLE